jgi:hypothetical protein
MLRKKERVSLLCKIIKERKKYNTNPQVSFVTGFFEGLRCAKMSTKELTKLIISYRLES